MGEIAEQEVEEEAARMTEHVEKKKKKAKHVPAEQKQRAEDPKAKPAAAKKQRKVSMKKKQLLKLKSFLAPSPVVELLVERIPEGLADASMEILKQMGIKK